ncbi:MAG: hypothetical protein IPP88_22630 [Betaproteobacteria bacterium]|nr:hypothetical protein [Betaproteobacteria bacterium]
MQERSLQLLAIRSSSPGTRWITADLPRARHPDSHRCGGLLSPVPRREFYAKMDAANVDLKAFTEFFYRKLTGSELAPVLDTLKYLKHETKVWFEILRS